MRMRPVNLCYYPTTIMLLDDKIVFLEKLELSLSKHNPLLIYNSSEKALEFFNNKYQFKNFIEQCVKTSEDNEPDHLSQDIDIRSIHKMMYSPARFGEITVLIVDYAMPKINGLEFSRQIKQKFPHIKIILLTGEADHPLAVDAFNEGIIDKFLKKDEKNIIEILTNDIHELQQAYFSHLSEICINNLSRLKELHALNDPAFIELFEKICKDNKIVEYYLMDNQGSFLLLNDHGKPSWLVIKTEPEIEGLIAHAEFDDTPSASVIEKLKSRKYIPYFHNDIDLETAPSKWDKYFHPAKKLQGKNIYYYAHVTDSNAHDIEPKKVVSYQEYLKNCMS